MLRKTDPIGSIIEVSFSSQDEFEEAVELRKNSGVKLIRYPDELMEVIKEYLGKGDSSKIYHIVHAVGASDYWDPTVAGNYFSEEELKKWYKHYEKEGKPYVNHWRQFGDFGKVLKSVWDDDMKRILLLVECDMNKLESLPIPRSIKAELHQKFESGEAIPVSNGVNAQKDICSICGNERKSFRDFTCEHIKNHCNEILPDGRKVYMINVGLPFDDISFLTANPADRSAWALAKVSAEEVVKIHNEKANDVQQHVYFSKLRNKTKGIGRSIITFVLDIFDDIDAEEYGKYVGLSAVLSDKDSMDNFETQRCNAQEIEKYYAKVRDIFGEDMYRKYVQKLILVVIEMSANYDKYIDLGVYVSPHGIELVNGADLACDPKLKAIPGIELAGTGNAASRYVVAHAFTIIRNILTASTPVSLSPSYSPIMDPIGLPFFAIYYANAVDDEFKQKVASLREKYYSIDNKVTEDNHE